MHMLPEEHLQAFLLLPNVLLLQGCSELVSNSSHRSLSIMVHSSDFLGMSTVAVLTIAFLGCISGHIASLTSGPFMQACY